MILVDTSVLINFLRGKKDKPSLLLEDVISHEREYGICDYVYLELLQGAKGKKEFNLLKEYLSTLPIYGLSGLHSFEQASSIHIRCREQGITIRSTIDLLIAQIAIENELSLLHNDKDFTHMAQAIDELRIFE